MIEALATLSAEIFVVVEQDMYPVDFDVPLPIATRTREYLRTAVGVPRQSLNRGFARLRSAGCKGSAGAFQTART